MRTEPFSIDRRKMIKQSATAAAISFLPFQYGCSVNENNSNAIIKENKLPGTQDWILKEAEIKFDQPTLDNLWMGPIRSSTIEGYCDKLYVKQGDSIGFHVSTKEETYSMDIFRIGYYQGNGGRLVKSLGEFKGKYYNTPEADPDTYLIECNWEEAHREMVPPDWVSGFYLVKLRSEGGWCNYMSFVVTDEKPHDYVFQVADFNSHAYNRWPEHHSLYNNIETGIDNYWGPRNVSSFRRPQGKLSQLVDLPLTMGAGEFFAWQYPFVFWAEKMGYDLTYISNMTLHESGPEILTRAKGFLVVGHDEYWTDKMYENTVKARDQAVSIGFFCGNSVFGRFRLMTNNGKENQHFKRDGRLSDKDLMGSGSGSGIIGGGDWLVQESDHWIFKGTGMKNGDAIEGIVGWECHNELSENIPNLKKVAYGPTNFYEWPTWENKKSGEHGEFISTYYDVEGTNGFVFNAATCWWTYAFDSPPGWKRSTWYDCRQKPDVRAMKITQNVMEEMVRRG